VKQGDRRRGWWSPQAVEINHKGNKQWHKDLKHSPWWRGFLEDTAHSNKHDWRFSSYVDKHGTWQVPRLLFLHSNIRSIKHVKQKCATLTWHSMHEVQLVLVLVPSGDVSMLWLLLHVLSQVCFPSF